MSSNPLVTFLLPALIFSFLHLPLAGQSSKDRVLQVKKTDDFTIDGKGTAESWSKAKWITVSPITMAEEEAPAELVTKAKVLYSETGIYFLFQCEDQTLTATMDADFMRLWEEDVVEVFLWPDETAPAYFEYELSPLNFELPLLISNKDENFHSWRPFTYSGEKRTRHKTSVTGGEKESGASVD